MTATTFSLTYEGYWRELNIGGIPAKSGVYSVYACHYNAADRTVNLDKLIYIGESVNVHDRILGHEKWLAWRRHLSYGQELCINFAAVSRERERAEAALIFHHKPPENTEFVNQFPYATTTVHTSGRNALLSSAFTVQPTRRTAFAYR